MFTKLLAHLLILTSLSANCTQLFVYAGFTMNQKYIAAELCINRDKPELNCQGKCYLMRKLKQAEQKEKAHENEKLNPVLQPAIVVERLSLSVPSFLITVCKPLELTFSLPVHSMPIFQPPKV
jgi:hypothetical protein